MYSQFIKIIFAAVFVYSTPLFAKLDVMTTTTDIGSLVKTVGGDEVKVFSVAKGTQDPHQIEAKPSFMVKFHNADLVVAQGLELETAWLDPLIRGSRNPKIIKGSPGYLSLGESLNPLEVPSGNISRAEGDVHPGGNPHFQLDPIRMGEAAQLVANKLAELDPTHKDLFDKNALAFKNEMEKKVTEWKERIAKTGIREIVTHHKTLTYFCSRFHLTCNLQLEPKPGIPPTTSHLLAIIHSMQAKKLKWVLVENYFETDPVKKLKTEIPDVNVIKVPVSVGGLPSIKNLETLYEYLVEVLEGKHK